VDSQELGMLLKNLYTSFDMTSFSNRLKLQKIVYLMQIYGLPLGFDFNFYLYGPYSTDLCRAGFIIQDYKDLPMGKFTDSNNQEKFLRFKEILDKNERKNNPRWLEMASSILFLQKALNYDKTKIYKFMERKISHFTKKELDSIWDDLSSIGWINA
jgi:uncharacterized protein YwgA